MLRPLGVTVHQCSCGYASIYKQKAARHASTCLVGGQRGQVTVLERVIPADAAQTARPRIVCGSAEEQRVWDVVIREYVACNSARTADMVVVGVFRKFHTRVAAVCVRGSSVVEYREHSETVVPLSKYCVGAAHDIAQRIGLLTGDGEAARIRALFRNPLNPDDMECNATWGDVINDRFNRRSLKIGSDDRAAVTLFYKDLESVLKNL